MRIKKVTKHGYDLFVTATFNLPRSDIDGFGILDFEAAMNKILKVRKGLSLKARVKPE